MIWGRMCAREENSMIFKKGVTRVMKHNDMLCEFNYVDGLNQFDVFTYKYIYIIHEEIRQ